MKEIDVSYLGMPSPADRGVRFFLDPDQPDIVRVQVDLSPPGAGTVCMCLGVDDLAKLAARMFAVAKQAKGELPIDRGRAN